MEKVNVNGAYEELMEKLFGSEASTTKVDVSTLMVMKKEYTKAMKEVQDKYGLKQGHPDFLEWVFTLVGRSPIIVDDFEEGDDQDEPTSAN